MEEAMKSRVWRAGWLALAVFALLGTVALARADEDPPGRAARLNYLGGSVSFRSGSVDEWTDASRNYPLTTGDHLWVDRGARAELHLGGSVVWLGPETAFSFLNLDDQTAQLRLSEGALSVRVTHLEPDEELEVDTPNAAVTLLRPGLYRIDVRSDGGQTIVSVRHGAAEVQSGGSVFPVREGESAYVSGIDDPSYDVREARDRDDWEDWCSERDRRQERSASSRYVSKEMVGYSDLDEHGSWREDAVYGAVWTPSHVDAGWAPYRLGHWAWIYPWGWTWVDDSPWGFAPFHYGRWAHLGGRWAWVPGGSVVRPIYAPALVVFLGGVGWSDSLHIRDGVGWFPLGPREVWVPPYAYSRGYVEKVNGPHVKVTSTDLVAGDNQRWVNHKVAGAVTAVPKESFVRARSFAAVAVAVPVAAVAAARVTSGAALVAQVRPRSESVILESRGRVAMPPARVTERQVLTRVTPPAPLKLSEQGTERTRTVRSNPLVRPPAPEGEAGKLRPVRSGIPAAQPVAPRAPETISRPRREALPSEKPPSAERERPSDRATPRPTPRAEPLERATPRPMPRPTVEERYVRPTPRPEPEATPRPMPRPPSEERYVRPTPRPEPEATPRPTRRPTVEREERQVRPTPRPDPEVVRTPRPTPRPEPEVVRTPRPTPVPTIEREERVRATPRPEPMERSTPRPAPKAEPKATPTPKPTPTPKAK
jgi:hypothetical protein